MNDSPKTDRWQGRAPGRPSGSPAAPELHLTATHAGMQQLGADAAMRAVLQRRSEALARRPAPVTLTRAGEPFIHFRLGRAEEYGIPYRFVEEVMTVPAITRVPCAPQMIAGVINRRGEMLVVLDLNQFFHGQSAPAQTAASIDVVVVQGAGLLIGIRVDVLIGNAEYNPSQLGEPLPTDGTSKRSYIQGLLNGHVSILDLDALLADPALQGNSDT